MVIRFCFLTHFLLQKKPSNNYFPLLGPGRLFSVIEIIQKECDRQIKRVLDEFKVQREFQKKVCNLNFFTMLIACDVKINISLYLKLSLVNIWLLYHTTNFLLAGNMLTIPSVCMTIGHCPKTKILNATSNIWHKNCFFFVLPW